MSNRMMFIYLFQYATGDHPYILTGSRWSYKCQIVVTDWPPMPHRLASSLH